MPSSLPSRALLAALAVAAVLFDRRNATRTPQADADAPASNVILVVSDGLRWQEVFRGADSLLMFGDAAFLGGDASALRRRYWRADRAERRQTLMPFVWGVMARGGLLLGNRDVGSRMAVTNGMNFSYPGYNELLVGYPDPRIDRNDYGPNPNVTVFEWLERRDEFDGRVAAVGAWGTFADIFNRKRSGIDLHVSRIPPLDERAHASVMRVLKDKRPRALFVAYVETDDAAHDGRYDRLLNTIHAVDAKLAALWSVVQASPQYRGRTTLIFTADHGRGATPRDWRDHGEDVAGSDQTWVAMLGPGVPAQGEPRAGRFITTSQIAATVAAALGLDYARANASAAAPIRVGASLSRSN